MVFRCGNPDQAGSTSCSNEYTYPALKIGWIGRVIPGIPANQYGDWKSSGSKTSTGLQLFVHPFGQSPGPLCLMITWDCVHWGSLIVPLNESF
jgi:hypothetical protein